jgi:hypothetical protein
MKGKNKVEVNPQLKAESFNHPIDSDKHKKAQKVAKIRNLAKGNKNPNEKEAAEKKAGGPKLYGEDKLLDAVRKSQQRIEIEVANKKTVDSPEVKKHIKKEKGRGKYVVRKPENQFNSYNPKESVMIQDANGNDFLEVIDVIKAEPLVPVKEGKVNGKQEKFNRAMIAFRKAKKAGNLTDKEQIDRLKDNAKLRRSAEKTEKKGKQFAGGQVYNEDKLDEISMRTARAAEFLAGKKADDAQKKGDKQTSDIKNYQKYKIGYMIRARERKLDKRKSDLERTLKKS